MRRNDARHNVDDYIVTFLVTESWWNVEESEEIIRQLERIREPRLLGGWNETYVSASRDGVSFMSWLYGDFDIDREPFIEIVKAWRRFIGTIPGRTN